ncbi:hypothetical protein [Labilithrix luteola]|uniref:hypothetical protein n=1 Tax=Labilithrix luteola TaxID=1391654 RepID=UPI0011BABDBE|nr:hypothetical protein [Labilithrix luteola]
MDRVVGRCSLCGGCVCIPHLWMGIYPPEPTCTSCGAVAQGPEPVIAMKRAPITSFQTPWALP